MSYSSIPYDTGDEEGSTVMPVLRVLVVTCEVISVLCLVTRITGIRHVEQ